METGRDIQEIPAAGNTAGEGKRRSRMHAVLAFIKDSIGAIFQGKFLLRMKFDRYFIHIIYLFFLAVVCIWMKLHIEQTMVRLEVSRQAAEDYRIYLRQKTSELAELGKLSAVQDMLIRSGSSLTVPDKPADRLTGRRTIE